MKKRLAEAVAQPSGGSAKKRRGGMARSMSAPVAGAGDGENEQQKINQLKQLRAAFREKRLRHNLLKRDLHTALMEKAALETATSYLSRFWDTLDSSLEAAVAAQASTDSATDDSVFSGTLEVVKNVMKSDVTAAACRALRIDSLIDKPIEPLDDDDEEEDAEDAGDGAAASAKAAPSVDEALATVSRATNQLCTSSLEPKLLDRCAKTSELLQRAFRAVGNGSSGFAQLASLCAHSSTLAHTTLKLRDELEVSATKLEREQFINEALMRRLDMFQQNGFPSAAASSASATGASKSGAAGSGTSDAGASSSSAALQVHAQLKAVQEQAARRLREIEELQAKSTALGNELSHYKNGDIPEAILERCRAYASLKLNHTELTRQLRSTEEARLEIERLSERRRAQLEMSSRESKMEMHKLKTSFNEHNQKLLEENQKYAVYADELKVKLQLQNKHAERIVEAEQREAQLAKLAESQREELARLREQVKTMRESNSGETEAQLYAEIEQLSDAYSKLEQQISDTVNQSKQRERVHRATLAEKQKLVQQNHLAKKQQELLRAQAQNYERTAAQAKSRVKAVEQRVDTLEREINSERTEVTKLRNTVSELRALQTNVGDQTAAVNQLRQQLSEAQNEVITLRSAATEQQASQRRLEDENARLQRELDALKTSIRDAGGNASRVQTKRMEKLYKELEKSLRCPVIPDLWKDVILIKCGHMFSSQAMQEALAKRNRKCPVCKTRYDKADIMPITIFQRNEVSS